MIDAFKRFPDAAHLIEQYKSMIGQAIDITMSDREDFEQTHSIRFTAMPNRGLFIGYTGRAHEANSAPLIERACRALKYRAKWV